MEWDRRTFVKFAVGGVLGFASSPFIPKLQDDAAIWTQNWSWVPVPENGELAFANSVNPETGTAVRARIIKGRLTGQRLIKVEGNPQHPLFRGGVIPQDASSSQQLYNGLVRVDAPIIRESKTGLRSRVSADKALDFLAGKLKALQAENQAHTLGVLARDPDSVAGEMLMRLMAAYGSANLIFLPRADDNLALAGWLMFGQPAIGFDLPASDCVISFGTPLLEGFGAPVAVRHAFSGWRDRGSKLIQVEPRASVTASRSDLWLACKPGTEGLVALGLGAILLEQGAYDRDLMENSLGFSQVPGGGFKELLQKEYGPDRVAKLSGVPVEKLKQAAKLFIQAKRPVAVCGPGAAAEPGRLYDFMSVLALNAMRGTLGRPGGVLVRRPLDLRPLGPELAPPAQAPLDGRDQHPLKVPDAVTMAERALAGDPYGLGALIVVNCNPAFSGPNPELMKELCRQVPLLVCISTYLDETAAMADIVLPAAQFLEGWGDCQSPYGQAVSSYGIHKPLVSAFPQAKSTGDWLLGLAARLGGPVARALPFEDTASALQVRCAGLGDFAELAQKSFVVQDKPAYGQFPFQTDSGKLELFAMSLRDAMVKNAGSEKALVEELRKLAVAGDPFTAFMPHYEPPAALGRVDSRYPLLMAAVPSLRTGNGSQPMSPYMLKILDDTTLADKDRLVVEMNPATAAKLHLQEGEEVEIASPAGSLRAKLHLYNGAAPGMVFAPVGLGHQVFGMYLKNKGENFFAAAQVFQDPLSGLPQWGLTPVRIGKARGVSHV